MSRPQVVLATKNPGKVEELRRILGGDVELLGLQDVTAYEPGPETGATFEENALAKAVEAVQHTGLPAVADDSGLAVDALNGMPGVLSARWSGLPQGDPTRHAANLQLVLAQLGDTTQERRGGSVVCAAAVAFPDGRAHVVRGEIRGTILTAPRGTNGFGYDPIFVPEGGGRTTAELDPDEKDAISHRGRAFRALAADLPSLLG